MTPSDALRYARMPKPEPVSVTTNKKPIENNQIAKNPQWQKAVITILTHSSETYIQVEDALENSALQISLAQTERKMSKLLTPYHDRCSSSSPPVIYNTSTRVLMMVVSNYSVMMIVVAGE